MSRSRDVTAAEHRVALLFSIVWTSIASAIYFSLGVVAGHALGLTPVVYLIASVMFGLTTMTYVEGASLHQDRGGATVFARYAFNELVSFVAGWAILLDYVILIAVTAFSATQYLRVFWIRSAASGVALALRWRSSPSHPQEHPRVHQPSGAPCRPARDRRPR